MSIQEATAMLRELNKAIKPTALATPNQRKYSPGQVLFMPRYRLPVKIYH